MPSLPLPPRGGPGRRAARARRRALPPLVFALALALADAAFAERLVVRYRAEGPHALEACAETLMRAGRPFRAATADASDSLDRLHARLGVQRVRALFRRPDGRSFAAQREGLRARLARAVARHRRGRAPDRARGGAPDLAHVYVLELPPGSDARAAAARLDADPHVAWAQPDFAVSADAGSDDPFYGSSGAWGQPFRDLWGLFRIDVGTAWDTSRGEGIVIAVVDTGLDPAHPDIADNVWINPGEDLDGDGREDASDYNGVDDDDNGFVDDLRGVDFVHTRDADGDGDHDDPGDVLDIDPFDDYGHGTHVAGTAAAVGDNGIGIVGVAPRARVMGLKGLDETGSGTSADLARAIVYAVEHGAHVINASWSCSPFCAENPLIEEVVRFAHAKGVVYVTSAGNLAEDVRFNSPEKLRETIVVASTTDGDERAVTSNLGWLVDVGAPGSGSPFALRNVLSLRSSGAAQTLVSGFGVGADYFRLSGTSMAAPHVAGLAALLLAADPSLTNEDVRALLRLGAVDLGAPGHDREFGAGRIDAARSLALAPPPRARGAIRAPAPGAVVSQVAGVVEVRGDAAGADLASFAVSVGRGVDPAAWQPLGPERRDPVDDGVLALWPVAGLESGSWVLRLVLTAHDGSVLEEFAPVSLERFTPVRISSPGEDALEPAISDGLVDGLVVWSSARARQKEGEEEDASPGDRDLFASDLRTGEERRIADAPGDQHAARVSGDHVVWLDDRDGTDDLYRCRLRGGGGCAEELVAEGGGLLSRPSVSGSRIAWAEGLGLDRRVRICEVARAGGRCDPVPLDLGPGTTSRPRLEGERLAWSGLRDGISAIRTCVLGDDARCADAPPILDRPRDQLFFAFSRDLFAWVELASLGPRLRVCQLGAGTGICETGQNVDMPGTDLEPEVSGDRVVWHAVRGDEESDVFLCEWDRVLGSCHVTRLTGDAAPQRSPSVDGDVVVWEDRRDGPWAIYGLHLPSLEPLADRSVRAGRPLIVRVRVRGAGRSERRISLRAQRIDGSPIEALGARFVGLGPWGLLQWRPGPDRVGSHAFTFTATRDDGFETSESLRVEVVEAASPRPASAWERWLRALRRRDR